MNKKKRTRKQQKDEYINQCMNVYKNGTITREKYVKKFAEGYLLMINCFTGMVTNR